MEGEFDTLASGGEMTDIPEPTGTQADTSVETEIPEQAQDASIQAGSEEGKETAPSPFATGKEKFKVGGKEVEWDWATAKRYAQLGYSGQKAMEKAANLEKQAKTTWQQIQQAALNDLPGLYRVLTGREIDPRVAQILKGSKAAPAAGAQNATDPQDDPRANEIHELKSEVGSLKEVLEKQALAEEAKLIDQELDAAVKEFPELDDPAYRHYVKAQYRRQLEQGIEDVTLNDVAFYVAQQIKERAAEREKKKIEARKLASRKAPVSTVPGSQTGDQQKPMTREDVMRLAGRM